MLKLHKTVGGEMFMVPVRAAKLEYDSLDLKNCLSIRISGSLDKNSSHEKVMDANWLCFV